MREATGIVMYSTAGHINKGYMTESEEIAKMGKAQSKQTWVPPIEEGPPLERQKRKRNKRPKTLAVVPADLPPRPAAASKPCDASSSNTPPLSPLGQPPANLFPDDQRVPDSLKQLTPPPEAPPPSAAASAQDPDKDVRSDPTMVSTRETLI